MTNSHVFSVIHRRENTSFIIEITVDRKADIKNLFEIRNKLHRHRILKLIEAELDEISFRIIAGLAFIMSFCYRFFKSR